MSARKIIVKARRGSKVEIVLKNRYKPQGVREPTDSRPPRLPQVKNVLYLPKKIIEKMEIRTESSFRPNQEDVEVFYALTGSDSTTPDMLHGLSTSEVVVDATPNMIRTFREKILEIIQKERGELPRLLVDIHTHPNSLPKMSGTDREMSRSWAKRVKKLIPGITVIFGVHAISGESDTIRGKTEAVKTSSNMIQWSSTTRDHKVGFYTGDAEPCEVEIIG